MNNILFSKFNSFVILVEFIVTPLELPCDSGRITTIFYSFHLIYRSLPLILFILKKDVIIFLLYYFGECNTSVTHLKKQSSCLHTYNLTMFK